ncbi:MAG: threonylcarbamoyl-AMP synthase [Chthonomonadales bacterium]|nr:threonylcarbamoyl-AMP synthase [Chthonomonadales bacterium]
MATYVRCDSGVCADERLAGAALALTEGELVVFPTETVYGLGAHALDADAVARIYAAKGRPPSNPLIVHVAGTSDARNLVADWPPAADIIASRFWPGPVTVVLPRRGTVPDIITAGGPTVAIRVPGHPVALALLRLAGVPVAAPSANESGMVSPTSVQHLSPRIRDCAAWIIDGGPCDCGIESTVVDLCDGPVRILRPGAIARAELENALRVPVAYATEHESQAIRSPGLLGRHYAPRAELTLVRDVSDCAFEPIGALAEAAVMTHVPDFPARIGHPVRTVIMPNDPVEYGRRLYATLQELDSQGVRRILVLEPPDTVAWEAVRDRLYRASLG